MELMEKKDEEVRILTSLADDSHFNLQQVGLGCCQSRSITLVDC